MTNSNRPVAAMNMKVVKVTRKMIKKQWKVIDRMLAMGYTLQVQQ